MKALVGAFNQEKAFSVIVHCTSSPINRLQHYNEPCQATCTSAAATTGSGRRGPSTRCGWSSTSGGGTRGGSSRRRRRTSTKYEPGSTISISKYLYSPKSLINLVFIQFQFKLHFCRALAKSQARERRSLKGLLTFSQNHKTIYVLPSPL